MVPIKYVVGDTLAHKQPDDTLSFIIHICNNIGGWGAGFVKAIDKVYPTAGPSYRGWFKDGARDGVPFELGRIQLLELTDPHGEDITLVNMIAQDNTSTNLHRTGELDGHDGVFVDYGALAQCLVAVADRIEDIEDILSTPVAVHCPRIGCGLGGGDWAVIESLLTQFFSRNGIQVIVYDLPETQVVTIVEKEFHGNVKVIAATGFGAAKVIDKGIKCKLTVKGFADDFEDPQSATFLVSGYVVDPLGYNDFSELSKFIGRNDTSFVDYELTFDEGLATGGKVEHKNAIAYVSGKLIGEPTPWTTVDIGMKVDVLPFFYSLMMDNIVIGGGLIETGQQVWSQEAVVNQVPVNILKSTTRP